LVPADGPTSDGLSLADRYGPQAPAPTPFMTTGGKPMDAQCQQVCYPEASIDLDRPVWPLTANTCW